MYQLFEIFECRVLLRLLSTVDVRLTCNFCPVGAVNVAVLLLTVHLCSNLQDSSFQGAHNYI